MAPFRGRNRSSLKRGGFSLVETTMALGIVSFGLLTTLGLIPIGMNTFRGAMDTSVSSYIVQQVTTDVRQSTVAAAKGVVRRFDDQGNELVTGGTGNDGAFIYYVNVVPQSQSLVPGGQSSRLTTVTVEVIKNPALQSLQLDASTGLVVRAPGLTISRFPFLVSE